MLREGHLGIGILAYLPVAAVFAVMDYWVLFGIGLWTTLLGSGLPDFDTRLIFVKHRGWTHTIWFILVTAVTGVVVGVVTLEWLIGRLPLGSSFVAAQVSVATVAVFAGGLTLGVTFHILGDTLTREGICLFHPVLPRDMGGFEVNTTRYNFGSLRAKNRVVNSAFLAAGLVGLSVVVFLAGNL